MNLINKIRLMLMLRTSQGIETAFLNKEQLKTADRLTADGLLKRQANRISATNRGFELLSSVIVELLEP